MLAITVIHDEHGKILHQIAVFSHISRAKEYQEQLDRLAHYDALTGLPNRHLLADRMSQAIVRSTRADALLAVCYLDLDGFKAVNDSYGHALGDELLIEIARRHQASLRAGDTVARRGGDEFVLLIGDLRSRAELELLLQRVLESINKPVVLGDIRAVVSASIGVILFPDDPSDADALLRHAPMQRCTQPSRPDGVDICSSKAEPGKRSSLSASPKCPDPTQQRVSIRRAPTGWNVASCLADERKPSQNSGQGPDGGLRRARFSRQALNR